MLEDYIALADAQCSAQIVDEIQALSLTESNSRSELSRITRMIASDEAPACMEAFVGYLSYEMTAQVPSAVVEGYLNAALQIHPDAQPKLQEAVAFAFARMDRTDVAPRAYFTVAGLYRLELPAMLHASYEGVPVTRSDDEAFAYHIYLTMIEDPRGPEGFAAALERASPDVDATSEMLTTLQNLALNLHGQARHTGGLVAIIAPFRDDPRKTRSVKGADTGPTIGETVAPVLQILAQ